MLQGIFKRPAAPLEVGATSERVMHCLACGDLAEADRLSDALLANNPVDGRVLQLRAVVAMRRGDRTTAIELLTLATQSGNDAQPLLGLGQLLQDCGHVEDATACYLRALALDPSLFDAHLAVATLLHQQGKLVSSEEHFRTALRLRPDSVEAENWLIRMLDTQGRFSESVDEQRRIQRLAPKDGRSIRLALMTPRFYNSLDQMHAERARIESELKELLFGPPLRVVDPVREIGITTFNLAYHGENDLALQKLTAQVCRKAYRPAYDAPIDRRPSGKIRIGFFSENFGSHSIGRLNKGLIAKLARERFEVIVFTLARHTDPIAQQIRASADHCIAFDGNSLGEIEESIAAQQLDVLFYPDIGMSPLTYFLAFSRLAPVQCVTWGHPVTTGIESIDYFISADAIEPPAADSHYSEQLVRLPAFFLPAYDRPMRPAKALSRKDLGLREDTHLYVCPQALFKLHPEFDAAIATILRRDRAGEIVLIHGTDAMQADLLRRRLARRCADVIERVRFLPRMPWLDCLNLMAVSDVMLDTFHFGGGNTSYEGLAMGVPIVTLPSAYLRGRFTLGCYRHLAIDECVAADPQQYVEIALKLAEDRDFAAQVRRKIDERVHDLFGCDAAVRAFESFCQSAVERRNFLKPRGTAHDEASPVQRSGEEREMTSSVKPLSWL